MLSVSLISYNPLQSHGQSSVSKTHLVINQDPYLTADLSCGIPLALSSAIHLNPSYLNPLGHKTRCLSLSQDAVEGHGLEFFDVLESSMVCDMVCVHEPFSI